MSVCRVHHSDRARAAVAAGPINQICKISLVTYRQLNVPLHMDGLTALMLYRTGCTSCTSDGTHSLLIHQHQYRNPTRTDEGSARTLPLSRLKSAVEPVLDFFLRKFDFGMFHKEQAPPAALKYPPRNRVLSKLHRMYIGRSFSDRL